MTYEGMRKGKPRSRGGQQIFHRWHWVRANDGGIFLASAKLGDRVEAGQVLGHVTDPISNDRTEVVTPYNGKVIGMAVNQVVIPGFAAFHLGMDSERPTTFPAVGVAPEEELDRPFDGDERPE